MGRNGLLSQVHVYKGGARDAAKGDHLLGWYATPLAALVDGKRVRWLDWWIPGRIAAGLTRCSSLQIKGTFPLHPPSKPAPYAPPGSTAAPIAYSCRIGLDIRADAATEEFCLGGRVLSLCDVLVSGGRGGRDGRAAVAPRSHAPPWRSCCTRRGAGKCPSRPRTRREVLPLQPHPPLLQRRRGREAGSTSSSNPLRSPTWPTVRGRARR